MRHAVVMAAGEGSRLRPLTERWPKPVLPIDGRAVIATLLRGLAAAGVEHAFVVTGHLAEQVEQLVGDGSGFGLHVTYARQPGVLGSADAVQRGLAAGAEPPFLVAGADTVFAAGALAGFAAAAAGCAGALAYPEGAPARLTTIAGGPTAAPLWAFGRELLPYLDGLDGPPYELAQAYERAAADGVELRGLDVGKTRDLTHPADLVRENFPYLA